MSYEELIQRIGYFRNRKNISARELSGRIDKHDAYINRLETKGFNLPTEVLLKIIEVLEITPQEFFADNYRTYKVDNELYNAISKLPSDKKQHFLEILKM